MHHIAMDALSLRVLTDELGTLYTGYSAGENPVLPELERTFLDFAQAQSDALEGDKVSGQVDYWLAQLAALPRLELPLDRPRRATQSGASGDVPFVLPVDLSDEFCALGGTARARPSS